MKQFYYLFLILIIIACKKDEVVSSNNTLDGDWKVYLLQVDTIGNEYFWLQHNQIFRFRNDSLIQIYTDAIEKKITHRLSSFSLQNDSSVSIRVGNKYKIGNGQKIIANFTKQIVVDSDTALTSNYIAFMHSLIQPISKDSFWLYNYCCSNILVLKRI